MIWSFVVNKWFHKQNQRRYMLVRIVLVLYRTLFVSGPNVPHISGWKLKYMTDQPRIYTRETNFHQSFVMNNGTLGNPTHCNSWLLKSSTYAIDDFNTGPLEPGSRWWNWKFYTTEKFSKWFYVMNISSDEWNELGWTMLSVWPLNSMNLINNKKVKVVDFLNFHIKSGFSPPRGPPIGSSYLTFLLPLYPSNRL
jgi:hypothetical protein